MAAHIVEGQVGNVVSGLTTDTTVLPFQAPRTRLNGALGPERSFAAGAWSRARLEAVRTALAERTGQEITGNDVVTAMVAGALRSWLTEHDDLPTLPLVAICPVSVRSRDLDPDDANGGNAFGTAVCNLGTSLDDPVERISLIHRSMAVAKQRVAHLGSVPSLLVAAPSILPTVVLPMLPFDPGLRPGYNLPISNVPGPRRDLYWNGAHVEELYPVSVVYDGMGLNVTVCSYADRMCFGFIAGRETVPDPEVLIPHTEAALAELESAAGIG
jgi:diacylglycerol O-acyltransferase